MDYGLLPPEINSARMYAGPGSGSLLAASAGWGALAADLHSIASGYQSVIQELTSGPWLGPASVALASAAAPYGAWLGSSAANADLAASQAAAAAAAHDAAFAMTVPPPVIAANRAQLATLIATNFLGQNTPAIAATEADYFEMWAQDAAAMYAYAAASATATDLTDFAEPAEVANPAGLGAQAAAVAGAGSAQAGVQNVLAGLQSSIVSNLKSLAAPFSSLGKTTMGSLKPIDEWLTAYTPLDDMASMYSKYVVAYVATAAMGIQSGQSFGQISNGLTAMTSFMNGLAKPAASAAGAAASGGGQALGSGLGGLGSAAAGAAKAGAVSAGMAKSTLLGGLSVPPSWTPVSAVTNPLGALTSGAGAAAPTSEGMNAIPMTPFGPMLGPNGWRSLPTYGFRPTVMAKPFAAG